MAGVEAVIVQRETCDCAMGDCDYVNVTMTVAVTVTMAVLEMRYRMAACMTFSDLSSRASSCFNATQKARSASMHAQSTLREA